MPAISQVSGTHLGKKKKKSFLDIKSVFLKKLLHLNVVFLKTNLN